MMWIAYIRYRKLGITLFNEGNTNFESLVMEHECNRFCRFYDLAPIQTIAKKAPEDEEDIHPKSYQSPPPVPLPPSDDDFPETQFLNSLTLMKELTEVAQIYTPN